MDDVSNATYRIALNAELGESFHISTFETISIRSLVEKICSLTGADFDSLVEVSPDRLGKDQAYLLDSNKLRDSLDWSDKVDLNKGLNDTLSWIDKNLETLKKLPQNYIHKL